jgi:hypothetical protein
MTVAADRPVAQAGGTASAVLVWLGLAILALAGGWLLLGAWDEGVSGGRDFVQDYAAVVKIGQWRNPYEPYNDVTQQLFGGPPHKGELYSFHAPSSLPLLMWLLPFAWVGGYVGAFLAWGVVSLLALWAVCWLTLDILKAPRPILAGLLAALALVTLPAVRQSFEEGQLNVVVAAGMVGCWAARRKGHSGLAGVLLGCAFALKPIPGLFFLYYAWRRDWRLLAFGAGTVAALSLIGVMLAGFSGSWLWATVNYPSHANVWPGYPDNASVRGFFTRIFGPSEWRPRPPIPLPFVSMLLWMLSGGLLTLMALVAAGVTLRKLLPPVERDEPRGDLEVAVLTILGLLVTPIVWPHYYVVLAMPVAIIATYLGRLILDGSVHDPTVIGVAASDTGGRSSTYDRRRRILPTVALIILGVSTVLLAPFHYVEPFAGVGGRQLIALLALYLAALITLGWSARAQGRGVNPAVSR